MASLSATVFLAGALVAAGPGGFGPAPASAQACMSQGQAQAAAQAGQVLPLGALVGQIQQALGGKIVDSRLCQRSGRLVYELSVLVAGQVRKLTVDAAGGGY